MDANLFDEDGIDRRGFLSCMAWAGAGVVYAMSGGLMRSFSLAEILLRPDDVAPLLAKASFKFVQISDSHIGFSKEANKDVIGTLQKAVQQINGAGTPDLVLHTGDLSHLSRPEEFDAMDEVLRGIKAPKFFVPGEHDVLVDNGKTYFERYGKQAGGAKPWYSFTHKGVHFVALVNVLNLKPGGLGYLGDEQLAWLEADLKPLAASTPIVVFAHVPLWNVYPQWGWGTDDGARALALLQRFGSVSVLNGHIHQVMQKVEGNITFHTARSTAFPQPAPGTAPSPGPMKVSPDLLPANLGITSVDYVVGHRSLAIVDSTLASHAHAARTKVKIDNFNFNPNPVTVVPGSTVVWTNDDDVPHTVVATKGQFKSKVLDTGESYSHEFKESGKFAYFCSIHPTMTGVVNVQSR